MPVFLYVRNKTDFPAPFAGPRRYDVPSRRRSCRAHVQRDADTLLDQIPLRIIEDGSYRKRCIRCGEYRQQRNDVQPGERHGGSEPPSLRQPGRVRSRHGIELGRTKCCMSRRSSHV
jgi:hypothetical protein